MPSEILRVSVAEAAKFFGLEQKTIRRAIKQGEVAYVIVRGRYRISFASLLAWSQGKPTVKNKLASKGVGQFVDRWKITNTHFSPNPARLKNMLAVAPLPDRGPKPTDFRGADGGTN